MLKSFSRLTALLLVLFGLSGCGSDSGSPAAGNGGGDVAGGVNAAGLFAGDPAALTLAAIIDYDGGDSTSADEISVDAEGVEIDRTNLDIALVPTATAGEVNALLESIGGKIINMVEGVNIILIQIPDPGDLAALDAVIAILEASELVDSVQKADMPAIDSLPGNFNAATTNLATIDHHLAVGAPAAWNAKAALGYPTLGAPLLLQSDSFGSGVPDTDFDINVLDPTDFFQLAAKPESHGYHVLGIMTGRHTTNPVATTFRDLVTGMYPGTVDLRVVDGTLFNRPQGENKIVKIIRQSGRRVVLNTSLHSGCPRPPQQSCVIPKALSWLRKLRGDIAYFAGQTGVWENNFVLHLTSAGNFRTIAPPAAADTKITALNSQYAAAKLLTGMTTSTGTVVPNVTNTLVVENRVNSPAPYKPGCLSATSKYPAEISAIGSLVWSFTDWTTTAGDKSGTSMSTPQVAALGAYIWALKPTLKPVDVINILQNTTNIYSGDAACTDVPAPVIDAYGAVLAVDEAKAIDPAFANPMDAPVRLAILDVVGDGGSGSPNKIFDEDDLTIFVNAFQTAAGIERDYSRYDLNGDDLTGGDDKKRYFNLDIDAALNYESVTQDIEGNTITFDENAVTDQEILCYYAYSPLYTGSTTERTNTLAALCGAPRILYSSDSDGDSDIYSMDEAGNNVKNLTNDSLASFAGSLSPDGTRIAFIQGEPSSLSNPSSIIVMDIDGGNKIQVPTSTNGLFSLLIFGDKPSWSPDGSKIAFTKVVTTPGTGTAPDTTAANLYVMNADGSGAPQSLTNSTGNTANIAPAWSPDGSKIAFTKMIEVTPGTETESATFTINIHVMNAGGGASQNLTNSTSTTTGYFSPDWSPDGTKIAYYVNTTANYFGEDGFYSTDIMVMNANGTGKSTLTSAAGADISPRWSPDGSKIAFSSSRDGSFEVFVMEANGNNQTKLTSSASDFNLVNDWQ